MNVSSFLLVGMDSRIRTSTLPTPWELPTHIKTEEIQFKEDNMNRKGAADFVYEGPEKLKRQGGQLVSSAEFVRQRR
jgi:hypothetical protein